jgi:integrase
LVSSNPVEDVGYKGRKNDAEEITVLTPGKLQRLFACADPEILPLYAIAAFAGVRWTEIERLNWDDIKESEIVISACIAKTRSRRIIPIRPALAAFLTERGTGSVLPAFILPGVLVCVGWTSCEPRRKNKQGYTLGRAMP